MRLTVSRRARSRRTMAGATLLAAVFFVLPVASASAGRLLATGHDADFHCAPGPSASPACSFMRAAVTYARGGAPDVTLPVLVIDNAPNQAAAALSNIGVPHVVVKPAAIPALIDTAMYSAVVVASDRSCIGCDLNPPPGTPDTALINAKAPVLLRFFNDGGGLVALSGAANAAAYYGFLPLAVGGQPLLLAPFTPTDGGAAIGLTAANTNCCLAHNSFKPAPTLKVAETDAAGRAETVIAEGTVGVAPPGGANTLIAPAIAPAGLDHFKCYAVSPSRSITRTVILRDQFATKRSRLRAPSQLCNPVIKTVGARSGRVLNPRAHLTCYPTADSPAGVPTRGLRLRNQFGVVAVRTSRAQTLCVPSLKRVVAGGAVRPPTGPNPERVLDHFRCYGVSLVNASRSVRLRDQFGRTSTRVIRLVRLCNPVQKTYRAFTKRIARRAAHLACYSIRDSTRLRPRNVVVRNQFGSLRLRAIRSETLCLPTFKQVLAVAGSRPGPAPAPIPTPVQFTLTLAASACTGIRGGVVHTLSASNDPARPGTFTAVLSGPGAPSTPTTTAILAPDGTFTATTTTPTTPGVYRWIASVRATDGGEASAAVDVSVPAQPASCPAPDLQFVSLLVGPAGGGTWSLTVRNAGAVAAGAFMATASANTGNVQETTTFSFPQGIAAGSSQTSSAAALTGALCPVSVVMDPTNAVPESDETNNTATVSSPAQLCQPPP